MHINTTKRKSVFLKGNPVICKPVIVSYLRNSPYTTNDNGLFRLFENIYGLIFIYLIITENIKGSCVLAEVGV